MGGFKKIKKTKILRCGLRFKANKSKNKKTNKIILIAVTWELGTLGDAPKRMVAMCSCMFFFCVLILSGNDI